MSEPNKDLKRIRAIRSGNRGVVTRYSKEAIELLYQGNETNKDRLRTIANLLNEKIIRLKELDAQVLELQYAKSTISNGKSKKRKKCFREQAT